MFNKRKINRMSSQMWQDRLKRQFKTLFELISSDQKSVTLDDIGKHNNELLKAYMPIFTEKKMEGIFL